MRSEFYSDLICDFQEFYGLDFDTVLNTNLQKTAILACGLQSNSRTMQSMNKVKGNNTEILLAEIADRLGVIAWMLGGGKNERPELLKEIFIPKEKKLTFASTTSFEEWRKKFIKGG